AKRLAAVPYDVKDVELGHHGKECSFEAILKKYGLTKNPALVLLGKIVNGADTDNTLYHQAEGPGLEPIAQGLRQFGYKDAHAVKSAQWFVYDALSAYCVERVRQGKPNGDFVPCTMDAHRRLSMPPRQPGAPATVMVRPLLLKPQWMNGLSERL